MRTTTTVPPTTTTTVDLTGVAAWVTGSLRTQWLAAVANNAADAARHAAPTRTLAPASAAPPTVHTADGDYHSWPDWPLWHAVGLCEQQGSGSYDSNGDGIAWHGSPAGGLPSSGYPGGLGLSRDFWAEFAPAAGVAQTNGAYATPGEQIRVARVGSHNGTRMGGWSSWPGCIQRREAELR